MGRVLEMGQWVYCTWKLHSIQAIACSIAPRRDVVALSRITHQHYIICGCRWSEDGERRVKRCARHPPAHWENE
jgi:hypothetical protein